MQRRIAEQIVDVPTRKKVMEIWQGGEVDSARANFWEDVRTDRGSHPFYKLSNSSSKCPRSEAETGFVESEALARFSKDLAEQAVAKQTMEVMMVFSRERVSQCRGGQHVVDGPVLETVEDIIDVSQFTFQESISFMMYAGSYSDRM